MASLTIAQALETALQKHRAGLLPEAKSLYHQILSYEPDQPDALHLLGVLSGEEGNPQTGERLIRQAIHLRPTSAVYHRSLARLLQETNRLQQALAEYARAAELDPRWAEALAGLGRALRVAGRLPEAIDNLNKALAMASNQSAPMIAQWRNELGVALAKSDRLDEALVELRAATGLHPSDADPHINAALVLQRQGRLPEALAASRRAIELRPDSANAYNTMGVILGKLGQREESISAARKAVQLDPNNPGFCANLVKGLAAHGEIDDSLSTCRSAIARSPNVALLHQSLAASLKDIGRLDESLAAFDRAIELDPNDASAHSGRIFARHFHDGSDQHAQAQDQRLWDQRHALPLRDHRPHVNDPDPNRRLRVGYISPDFTSHVLAFSLLPLFRNHDPSFVETHFYSDVPNPGELTQRFRDCADRWTNIVGFSDAQAAQKIREDKVDILVDLTMHMRDNRLLVFARKPAPIQVTFGAYPGSTGLSAIDYRLTDPYLDPPGMFDEFYSERSIRLPQTFWCYDPLSDDPHPSGSPVVETGIVTFGCLNNFCKINHGILSLWARVLRAVPNSRLLMLCRQGSHRGWVHQTLAEQGVPADRVELVQGRPRPEYLRLYHRIDISLDPLPYNGHMTSLDSFWMGVPVITLAGPTVVGRAGLSQFTNLGLTELIADSADHYVELAANLGSDVPRLTALRAGMRRRMKQSPLMDGKRFAGNVEAAYRQMWRNWCEQRGRQRLHFTT